MQTFDFDGNADFQAYLKRIDMDAVTGSALDRVKRKWFEKTFPDQAGAAYTGPRPTAPPPSPPQSRASGGGAARARPAPAAAAAAPAAGRLDAVVALQGATVALAMVHVLGFVVGGLGFALKFAYLAQIALWSLVLFRQVGGFSLTGEFVARCFQNDASHYAIYSLLFWATSDSLYPLVPLLIYSFFNSITTLALLHPLLQRVNAATYRYREQALSLAVQLEVFLLPYLIVNALFGGSWIAIMGHYYFLKFRYMFSAHTRAVVTTIVGAIDSKVLAVPAIAQYYFRVRNWFAVPMGHQ